MRIRRSIFILMMGLFVLWPLATGFGQTNIADIQRGAEKTAQALAVALPFNSTVGLNWSDAYIGQILGVPPHFGVGITAGATTVPTVDLKPLLTNMGVSLPAGVDKVLPLPVAVAEARVGGILLPFDVGIKAGYIPDSLGNTIKGTTGGLAVKYLLVGADIRYAVLKGNLVLPTVSVGLGVNYMDGGLGTTISGGGASFTYNVGAANHTIAATDPEVGVSWRATTVDLKAQVSKGFLFFTPYAGFGATYGASRAGYYVKSNLTYDGDSIDPAEIQSIKNYLQSQGVAVPDISATGIESYFEKSGWAFRAYGGFSFNLAVMKFDLTGLYNFSDGSYGASLGLRFQL